MFNEPTAGHEIWDGHEVEYFWDDNVSDEVFRNLLSELFALRDHPSNTGKRVSALVGGAHVAYRPGFVLHHAIVGYRGCDDSALEQSPLRMAPNFVVDFTDGLSDPQAQTRREILEQAGVEAYWRICVYEDSIEVYESSMTTLELTLKLNVHCRAAIPPFAGALVAVKTLLYSKAKRKHIQLPPLSP